jgi:hypothetical protein
MMRDPTLFELHEGENGTTELWYDVNAVSRKLRVVEDGFELRAWERNLKHAGLVPIQTHATPKKWVLQKAERNPLSETSGSELIVGHSGHVEVLGQ